MDSARKYMRCLFYLWDFCVLFFKPGLVVHMKRGYISDPWLCQHVVAVTLLVGHLLLLASPNSHADGLWPSTHPYVEFILWWDLWANSACGKNRKLYSVRLIWGKLKAEHFPGKFWALESFKSSPVHWLLTLLLNSLIRLLTFCISDIISVKTKPAHACCFPMLVLWIQSQAKIRALWNVCCTKPSKLGEG